MVVGSIGRAVASDTSGPRFKSSHWQDFPMSIFSVNCCKDENKEKEAKMAQFLQKMAQFLQKM